jgi:hypothetical protein
MFVLLDAIDVTTASWVERRIFEIEDLNAFRDGLALDQIEPYRAYELDAQQAAFIEQAHDVAMSDRSLPVEMVVLRERYKYDEFASHTGRELLLMLAGKKPLAAFATIDRPENEGIIPEDLFEPHIAGGRLLKHSEIVRMMPEGPVRRVLYSLPGEEWRIEAYSALWRLADRHGWNDGFERMEGYLLGYETEIDPFHK